MNKVEKLIVSKAMAAELQYSKESNMARDFRKVLNISPEEVRNALLVNTPIGLFANI